MNASPRWRRPALTLALLAFAQFIITIDYNIVYVALPDIGDELGFTAQSLQWVVSAYLVGFGGFLLLGGRAVDRLGQRRMFILGLAIYGVSSLAGGLAADPGMLVAARAFQGLGGALLTPATLALIYTGFPEGTQRNRAMGVWGAAGSSGLAAGALLGGILTNDLGWEWVFFVNVPLALGAALAAPRLLSADPPPENHRGGFDMPGALIATAGASLMVFGLVSGPDAGWGSIRGAGALAAGAVLIGVFALVEWRTRNPLVPLRLFANRSLATAMAVMFLFLGSLSGQYYLFTTYLQNVLGYSALEAGLAFLPLTLISVATTGKLSTVLLGKWGTRTTLSIGLLVIAIGMILLAAGMSTGGSFWALLPGIVIWGVGSFGFPAMFVAAASGVEPAEQGVASALASTSQQIGGAVGLAAIVAIANTGLTAETGAAASDVVDGLRTAGWVAGLAMAAAAIIAATLKKPRATATPKINDIPEEPAPDLAAPSSG
ncbi:MFS transporter [Streptosporangium sp. NBC_01495]|uniref:MFS transporter n=1 Tax=Streptosporangium sp. NBC_01495 TaxID=2903899 RepID=UPI002E375001|nr:MFS transporter [Streptosporangium sp. NBC_01495]